MEKVFQIAVFIALVSSFLHSAEAGDLAKLSDGAFRRLNAELDKIETEKGAAAAKGEIVVARQWIEQGRLLLLEGRVRKAAQVAERLPQELELIRILVATGAALEDAKVVEEELHAAATLLGNLKARYNRLILRIHGAEHTNASPQKKGDTQ